MEKTCTYFGPNLDSRFLLVSNTVFAMNLEATVEVEGLLKKTDFQYLNTFMSSDFKLAIAWITACLLLDYC